MRSLLPLLFIVILLIFLYIFLKSFYSLQKSRKVKGPNFDRLRREIDHGRLHKDPISGTYVSESDAIVVEKKGKKYYFASEETAERFRHGEQSD